MIRLVFLGILLSTGVLNSNQNDTDRQTVIQMCIDLEELQPFYHSEEKPDRKPLIIFNNGIVSSDLALTKFGEEGYELGDQK